MYIYKHNKVKEYKFLCIVLACVISQDKKKVRFLSSFKQTNNNKVLVLKDATYNNIWNIIKTQLKFETVKVMVCAMQGAVVLILHGTITIPLCTFLKGGHSSSTSPLLWSPWISTLKRLAVDSLYRSDIEVLEASQKRTVPSSCLETGDNLQRWIKIKKTTAKISYHSKNRVKTKFKRQIS